jgi:hypothetical protein
MDPKDFRGENLRRMYAAAQWLRRSVEACRGEGSSAYYTPILGWADPYPETTGYLVETLIKFGHFVDEVTYVRLGLRLASWLLSTQNPDGSFQAGRFTNKPQPPTVFNTAQVLFGLMAAFEASREVRYMLAARRAAAWLCAVMDAAGRWSKFNYRNQSYSPTYYSRVSWPLLVAWKNWGNPYVRDCAVRSLQSILDRQNANGSFREWGFMPATGNAFTHTIAYTIEGLLQAGLILGGTETECWRAGYRAAEALFRRFEIQKQAGGAYDQQWKADFSFTCVTGNLQLALCWLIISEQTSDARFLNAALKILDVVQDAQWLLRWPRSLWGAFPGSKPLWGPYMRFRYPNWAAKFYLDAMMMLEDQMDRIEKTKHASCADRGVLV